MRVSAGHRIFLMPQNFSPGILIDALHCEIGAKDMRRSWKRKSLIPERLRVLLKDVLIDLIGLPC